MAPCSHLQPAACLGAFTTQTSGTACQREPLGQAQGPPSAHPQPPEPPVLQASGLEWLLQCLAPPSLTLLSSQWDHRYWIRMAVCTYLIYALLFYALFLLSPMLLPPKNNLIPCCTIPKCFPPAPHEAPCPCRQQPPSKYFFPAGQVNSCWCSAVVSITTDLTVQVKPRTCLSGRLVLAAAFTCAVPVGRYGAGCHRHFKGLLVNLSHSHFAD